MAKIWDPHELCWRNVLKCLHRVKGSQAEAKNAKRKRKINHFFKFIISQKGAVQSQSK